MSDGGYRVLGINGSPRGDQGITDVVMRRFLKGAESAGAEIDIIYPAKMKIAHCLGDLDCWFKTGGQCRHKDDMPIVALKYAAADLEVFACPLYVDGMTSYMKKMFERFLCYSPPFVEFDGRRSNHPRPEVDVKDHKVVVISTCGFPEREHFQALSLHYRRLCQNMHAQLIGEFYFPGSYVLIDDPSAASEQLDAVERAGHEAVRTGAISDGTIEGANRDYIDDPAEYDEQLNQRFHRQRRKSGLEP
jgi:NADPH-dependent FMN reductase